MRLTLEQVKARLDEAGAAPPPRPRPEFVDALESRLLAQAAGGEEPAVLRQPSHPIGLVRPRRALLALAAVGAVLIGLVLAPSGQDGPGRLRTVDVGTATTPEPVPPAPAPAPAPASAQAPDPVGEPVIPAPAPSPAVTAVSTAPLPRPPARSRPRSARAPAPAPAPAPATSIAPPTTTAASPAPEPAPAPQRPRATATSVPPPASDNLALRCHAGTGVGGPQVSCEWSESSSPQFAGYRLMRKTASGGTVVKVFATRDRAARSYIDTAVQQSESYSYMVEVKDASGRVIARSGPVSVTCCPA